MFRRIINTSIPGSQPQINLNTTKTNTHTTAIAVNDQLFLTSDLYTKNDLPAGGSVHNLYQALAANALITTISAGRTITFHNGTASTSIDLYLTVGGSTPQPITLLATITSGNDHIWSISDTIYNWTGNFTTMPTGTPPPQYNAGPTLVEFGLNQYWQGSSPDMRDTFDISTVPPGIGTGANDGPRSLAVSLSRKAGFTNQQSYNYNIGAQIIPPATTSAPPLPTVSVTCTATNGDSSDSIGYPNDTAVPKQQTGDALGSYTVNFLDPVVSLT